jgi:hypothetical protein
MDSGEKWRGVVTRNIHAHNEFEEYTIKLPADEGLYEKAECKGVLTVWAHAQLLVGRIR